MPVEVAVELIVRGVSTWDVVDLRRIRAEINAGYFGPDRRDALARIDVLLAELDD